MKTIEVNLGEKFEVILKNCPMKKFKKRELRINLIGLMISEIADKSIIPEFEIEEV